ncbi:MAG: type II toxin-antitoxin system ParD family antitoxin [Isosphaerales bacterium]
MTIQLPNDLESLVQTAVHSGRFASVDDAMAEAVRLLLRELTRGQQTASDAADPGLGSIGAMRDDADLLDQAVEHAMKVREERPWWLSTVE